ncbi:hypothetical protein [Pontimicrobium sp. SW4]|uniref:Lipoprotein n=1 Tax=Pontimicrobium sp. SW4 TaxID=3153519 RepID=A0AAU7BQT2_9FLAO
MSKHIFKWLVVLSCITGCKTISVQQEFQKTTQVQQTLGSIGNTNGTIISSAFAGTAVPVYKKPIKVIATSIPFTKHAYKAFLKAKIYQSANIKITYVDSLTVKPTFVQLQLADKVALIEALNSKDNIGVKDYLGHHEAAALVTNISIALNKQEQELLTKANTVQLIQDALGNYVLQCYLDDKQSTLQFNQGVVFAYKAVNSCWQENSKQQLTIVDLITQGRDCPRKTYKSRHNAKKRVDYFKL